MGQCLRRPPPLRTPLDSLADVELQLIMQFLDQRSRFTLARCSRRLLHAASHPFAWKDAQLRAVSIDQLLAIPPSSSLLRVIPLSLRLDWDRELIAMVRRLAPFLAVGVVHELHVFDLGCDEAVWEQLFCSPALRSLRRFSGPDDGGMPTAALRLLVQLPQLRSLSFPLGQDSLDLGLLPSAPRLTHLSLVCLNDLEGLRWVRRCLRLRSLRLAGWGNPAHSFWQLFRLRLSRRQRVERLELEEFCAQPSEYRPDILVPTVEQMCGCLASMQHLTELRLKNIQGLDTLLACLHSAPALRVLELRLEAENPFRDRGNHPSKAALRALLERAPQLRVRLLMAPSADQWLADFGRLYNPGWFRCEWNNLRHDFSHMDGVEFVDVPPRNLFGPP